MDKNTLKIAKGVSFEHNVSLRVLDAATGEEVQRHTGHNAATCSMVTGIGHYLKGDGVLNQGYHMLSAYVPKYISLGTMGLFSQDMDEDGLPKGIGYNADASEEDNFHEYMLKTPGFGADGYDPNANNDRTLLGLGYAFNDELRKKYDTKYVKGDIFLPLNCELISPTFPRSEISFRDVVPEWEAELPQTVDVVLSAMISTGALHEFRLSLEKAKASEINGCDCNCENCPNQSTCTCKPGSNGATSDFGQGVAQGLQAPYLFITEAGLWADREYDAGEEGENLGSGMLAGYRIAPPSKKNWFMKPTPDGSVSAAQAKENRDLLKKNILRVGPNQVVQVIWKIQIGGMDQLGGINALYQGTDNSNCKIYWYDWDENGNDVYPVPVPDPEPEPTPTGYDDGTFNPDISHADINDQNYQIPNTPEIDDGNYTS